MLNLALIGLTLAAPAQALVKKDTNIPQQSLGSALREFAKEHQVQLFVMSDLVDTLSTPGLSGRMTTDEAMQRLLAGTRLTYKYLDENTIAIMPPPASTPAPRSTGELVGEASGAQGHTANTWLHLAQALREDSAQSTEPASQPPVRLEEVLVTAQKRSERLLDVPMSIVAVGGDELQQRQITSLQDLQAAVPGLGLAHEGAFTTFEIRGISNVTGTGPLIGLYIDDADITLQGGTQINPTMYDLERVEVLRGPQGTLYGEGSAGGTVRLITKQPDLRQWTLDSLLTASFTQSGDPSERVDAAINVPLIEGQLGLRIAATAEHDGGWIDEPLAQQQNINAENLSNVRIKGLWQPDEQWTVSAMVIVNRDKRGVDFSDVGSPGVFTQVLNAPFVPTMKDDFNLYSLTVAYNFGAPVRVQNTISYLDTSQPMYNFTQIFPALQTRPETPVPDQYFVPLESFSDRLLTDELRLSSVGSGPWQWTVGGFFRRSQEDTQLPVLIGSFNSIPFPTPPGLGFASPSSDENNPYYTVGPNPPVIALSDSTRSWSGFADTSYRVLERLTLGAGVRYFRDSQSYPEMDYQEARFHSIDPRAYAQFKLSPDINLYLSAAKGFRSGGINAKGSEPKFHPESVWTYEFGTKLQLLDGRINFDTALFLSNYTDYVVVGELPGSGLLDDIKFNAGDARIKGIESSATWQVLPRWRLEMRGDYLNARFTAINALQATYESGDPVDFVPRYQLTISGQHDFILLGKPGTLRLDYSQQGPETYRNRNILGPSPWYYAESGIVKLLGAHASLTCTDNLRVGLFGQNLLNDQHYTTPYWLNQEGGRSRPRTFGVEISATFQ